MNYHGKVNSREDEIISLFKEGYPSSIIAEKIGCSQSSIDRVITKAKLAGKLPDTRRLSEESVISQTFIERFKNDFYSPLPKDYNKVISLYLETNNIRAVSKRLSMSDVKITNCVRLYVDSRKEIIDSGATQRKIESKTYDTIVKRYIMGDKKHSIAHDLGLATNTVCTYVAYYDFFMSSGEVLSEAFSKDQEEFRKLYIEGYTYEEIAEKFKMGLSSTKLKITRLKKLGIIDNNDVVARSKALMEISASPTSAIVKVDTPPVKDAAVKAEISSRITDGKDQIIHLYLNNNDPVAIHRLTKVNIHIVNNVIKAFEESKNTLFSTQKDGLSRSDYKTAIRLYTNGYTVDSISNKLGFSLDIVRAYVHFYEKGTMDSNTKDETIAIEEKVEETHQPELIESSTEETEEESMNNKLNIPVTESRLIIDLGEGQRIEVNGDVAEFASILDKLRSGDASLQGITNIGKYLNDTDIDVYEMEEVSC